MATLLQEGGAGGERETSWKEVRQNQLANGKRRCGRGWRLGGRGWRPGRVSEGGRESWSTLCNACTGAPPANVRGEPLELPLRTVTSLQSPPPPVPI
ncbi:Hypothetical predicted protein [Pelobates cultripes]|uniref:Uncharacterized protein n=1 Tax=Pelobates cultripes TaxID=61616 RepID=A0AAD1RTA5_PELCU|nr:Hypothetical predicted protein [Pelobates cultripes]